MKKEMQKKMLDLFKQTEDGNHDAMMEAIELLIDTKADDPFSNGYTACIEDLSVRSYRLAEHIEKEAKRVGKKAKDDGVWIIYVDELAKVIEDYFTKALKHK
jgi:hypothetical protein